LGVKSCERQIIVPVKEGSYEKAEGRPVSEAGGYEQTFLSGIKWRQLGSRIT
jgi:hypothetical protein